MAAAKSDFTRSDTITIAINRMLDDNDLLSSLQAGAKRAAEVYNSENQEQVLLQSATNSSAEAHRPPPRSAQE